MRCVAASALCAVVCVVSLPAAFARPAADASTRRTTPDATFVATPRHGVRVVLRERPGGRALTVLRRKTRLGSPVKLTVVRMSGSWLEVISERLPNGRLGWIPRRDVSLWRIDWSIHVSLSRRILELRHDGTLVRRTRVAIGAPSSPTPVGRYAITDHLDATHDGPAYGCCILVLSGHQPHPPASFDPKTDWRLAIHGGGGIGSAVSAGCLHASDADLRLLMRLTPLGTPVVIAA